MFGPRTPRYPLLKAYLANRPVAHRIIPRGSERLSTFGVALVTFIVGLSVLQSGFSTLAHPGVLLGEKILTFGAGIALLAASAFVGLIGYRIKPPLPPTPEQELSERADKVVAEMKEYQALHRALHPAVAATLEECAGYWARINTTLNGPLWTGSNTLPQWASLRQEALLAAKLAMDEAIIHGGATLVYAAPTKPLEHVSDALEDIGFGPIMRSDRQYEPMPPSFKPVRELAERLRELAERCETAATQRREESPEPISAAFRRLDATLGEMRNLEEAEGELRQNS